MLGVTTEQGKPAKRRLWLWRPCCSNVVNWGKWYRSHPLSLLNLSPLSNCICLLPNPSLHGSVSRLPRRPQLFPPSLHVHIHSGSKPSVFPSTLNWSVFKRLRSPSALSKRMQICFNNPLLYLHYRQHPEARWDSRWESFGLPLTFSLAVLPWASCFINFSKDHSVSCF